jgi:plasmid maintenance system antidote protein VapI
MARRTKPPGPTVVETLRSILAEQVAGGRSKYDIAKSAGLDFAIVSRFVAGQTGLTGPSIDRLAWSLGLRLTPAEGPAVEEREVAHVGV